MGLGPVLNVLIQLRLTFREIIQGEVFSEEWRALVAECAGIHKHAHTHAHTHTHSHTHTHTHTRTHTHTHTHTGEVFSEEWRTLVAERAGIHEPLRDVVSIYGTGSVLQYVAVCCNMLQRETARCCIHLWHL